MTTAMAEGLVLKGVSKSYGGHRALDDVDFQVARGEIHALLGHNGSGKSTLIKVLAGYHPADSGGRAWLDGEELALGSRVAARDRGLRFVHQDLGVIGEMSVLDNLVLGGSYERSRWVNDRFEADAARGLLEDLGLDIDPRAPLSQLAPPERATVAIARAVRGKLDGGGALLLDEPTATLSDRGTDRLFALIRRVRDLGTPVVYVTHRLREVLELADRVTVLRNGRKVATEPVADISHERLVELIVGAPPSEVFPSPPPVLREVMLQVRGLSGNGVRELSFDLHRGEILGVAGLEGSGRDRVCQLLFGGQRWDEGEITLDGTAYSSIDPAAAIAAGMAYVPADRASHGAIPALTLRENLTLPKLRAGFARWMSLRAERSDAQAWLQRMAIRPADPERAFSSLSGGNQQRVLIARWLRCEAKLLLFDEPTQGVDVQAKTQIYRTLAEAGRQGTAVLLASSDVEELAAICDRVLVIRDGAVVDVLHGAGLTADSLSYLSIGQAEVTQ